MNYCIQHFVYETENFVSQHNFQLQHKMEDKETKQGKVGYDQTMLYYAFTRSIAKMNGKTVIFSF